MKGFFLPWNEREKQVKRGEKKLYLPKETLSLTDAAFDTHKPAYVSLPNPRGITPVPFCRRWKTEKRTKLWAIFPKESLRWWIMRKWQAS